MSNTQKATFAAGCFWGVESAFRSIDGVLDAAVGYIGGHTEEPTYEQVCYTDSGHAEAVEVLFDPDKVSYQQLVESFWKMHDPTQVNRQGPDRGSQYRSAIFTYGDEQAKQALESKEKLESSGRLSRPVATLIEPAPTFWRAEEYHQRYDEKHGRGSCHL